MRRLLGFVVLSLLALGPVIAKPPADHDRKVACNKGWGIWKKQHGLKGYDRKKYIADCMSGKIEPPVRVPGSDD